MAFVTSLIFIALLYVLPLQGLVERRLVLVPFLGRQGSWLVTAMLIYGSLYFLGAAVLHFHEVIWPDLPRRVREITRRTGIFRFDTFFFRLALLATLVFTLADRDRLPLGLAALLGFGSLVHQPVKLRPVGSSRGGELGAAPIEAAVAESGNQAVRTFPWSLNQSLGPPLSGQIEIAVDERRYRRYAADNPAGQGRQPKLGRFVQQGLTDEVAQLANEVFVISQEQGFSSFQELSLALAVVQAIPDPTNGRQYLRFPVEVLYERGADADSKTVLLAALAKCMNYGVLLLEQRGRLAAAVSGAGGLPGRFIEYEGERYYYCPVAEIGRLPGQLPADMVQDQFRVHPID